MLGLTSVYGQSDKTTNGISIELLNGTWIHERDSLAIVEIQNNIWTFKYLGDNSVNDHYVISLKDTMFGSDTTISKILVLRNKSDELEYEILGLNYQILSLMHLPTGRLILYNKQTNAKE